MFVFICGHVLAQLSNVKGKQQQLENSQWVGVGCMLPLRSAVCPLSWALVAHYSLAAAPSGYS